MKALFGKMQSKAGESLIESMVAILIFTLSSIVMYSMVTAAADINATAKQKDLETQQQMAVAEMGEGTGTDGTVTFSFVTHEGATRIIASENVSVYGEPDNGLYSYYAEPDTDPEEAGE